ncbi:MAG: DUF896 domain-containing protein [Sporolactobacillus sp.]
MSQLIDKINRLARISRERPLNEQERKEQDELRKQYLAQFRARFTQQLSQIRIIDPEGRDVTPGKGKRRDRQ